MIFLTNREKMETKQTKSKSYEGEKLTMGF